MTPAKGEAHNFPDNIQHKLRGGLDVQNKNNGELTPGKSRGFLGVCTHMHDKVRNERIAARAMGDATRATQMGNLNTSLLGRWGMPLGQQRGDSTSASNNNQKYYRGVDSHSTTKVSPLGQEGGTAQAKQTGVSKLAAKVVLPLG